MLIIQKQTIECRMVAKLHALQENFTRQLDPDRVIFPG